MSSLQGWGRGTWGQGPWNEKVNVLVTGVQGTTALGSPLGLPSVFAEAASVSATVLLSRTSLTTIVHTVTVVTNNPSNHPYYNVGSYNKFAIGGSTATVDVTLDLQEGNTYRFDQSDSSNNGHPLRFSITPNGSHGGGSEYTTGVTTNGTPGSSGAYTQIVVALGAPTLYYYCTNHSAMGWTANTPGAVSIVTTTGAPVTTVVGTTALGSETAIGGATFGVTLAAAQTTLSSVVTVAQSVVFLTGVSASGATGEEQVYSLIEPTQEANWIERAA